MRLVIGDGYNKKICETSEGDGYNKKMYETSEG